MKLGVNLLCVGGLIEAAHLEHCRLAAQEGYDGVEIPVLDGSPEHYGWLGAQLDAMGLERTCTAIVPDPGADPTSANPTIRARGIAHLDWILDCATALGAQTIGGPFHAPIGHFTGSGPTMDEWQRGAEAHHLMAEKAAERGILLALEPLNRFETHFLNTAEQAAHYCEMVDHPAFGIMYDTFHSHIEEKDQASAIRVLAGRINVLHVSENDRGVPGTGQIDFPSVFSAVKATGFDGWVVMEAFGAGVPEIAAATRIWRPMFEDHPTLFRDSARFIREAWERA
ncbi:sugar phosphate isomerase/epimerase [Ruegeria sp. 2012CJ41-6]|uniref:Sugar phosphate isomerase/epimerase n=1 Tax=Ruegeria spongiae TaxID=2942209 RepID=A0ABT0PYJ1_9RHOB|nr:sugar phosphate isomerase/epimerase family protein [Ruegeria spongiae]MCL6282650.1 sugar phosphate isomerase/epimerase [Ruegeria spongiae]